MQCEQIRKEADDTGPLAELEHWRRRTAKFNAILEQIKGPAVRLVLNVLHVVKSKVLQVRNILFVGPRIQIYSL